MPDFWNLILDSSTLPDVPANDMWEHLNSLGAGGGGPCEGIILLDGLNISLNNYPVEVELDTSNINILIDRSNILTLVDQSGINAQLDQDPINVEALSTRLTVLVDGCTRVTAEGELMIKTTAENVGGHRIVTVNDVGHILHADKDLVLDGKQCIGMTLQAVAQGGECAIAISGDEVSEPTWNWTTTLPIYLGDDGVMTQTPPTEGFILIVAVPLTSNSLRVRIEMPIFL